MFFYSPPPCYYMIRHAVKEYSIHVEEYCLYLFFVSSHYFKYII